MNDQSLRHFSQIKRLMENRTPFATVTLITSKGHVPQDSGSKMIVTESGLFEGTVGGGKIEAKAIDYAREMIARNSPPEFVTWNLQRDISMSCGGEVSLFFESHFTEKWPIAVFGAGHVAQELVPLLLKLDCTLTCVDSREDWMAKFPESPRLKKIVHPHPAEVLSQLSANTYLVVMTQGHATDLPILKAALIALSPPYIGVLGSPVKASKIRQELAACGISPERIENLRCPMGLSIGNNSPVEIAISVVAQLLQTRDFIKK